MFKSLFALFLIILIFVQYSCKKIYETKYIPITHSWSLDSALSANNKILLTSVRLNDSILAVANSYSIIYVYTNNLNSVFGISISGNDIYSTGLVPPSLTQTVTVSVTDNPDNLAIFKTYMPHYMAGMPLFYSPSYSESVTSAKGFPSPTIYNAGYPVIKSKYVLAPYEIDFNAEKATLSIIEIDTSDYCFVTSSKEVILDNPPMPGFYSGVYYSWAYYDKFFLTLSGHSYRVDTLGNFKCLTESLHGKYIEQMFTLNNYLFALGWGEFFVSEDQGENWTHFSDSDGTNWGILRYFNAGNEVYATYLSQIARVSLIGNTLNIDELDNDGLEGNLITSINKCGKYAFVSTLSGLFYRDTANLNTIK